MSDVWRVTCEKVVTVTYLVPADSEREAIDRVSQGDPDVKFLRCDHEHGRFRTKAPLGWHAKRKE